MAQRIGDLTGATTVAFDDVFEKELNSFGGSNKITANNLRKAIFAGGASFDAVAFSGTSVTSAVGTITASTPNFSGTATWNSSGVTFTGIKLNVTNTASAAGSLLLDLQVGGTSQFKVDKAGNTTLVAGSTLAAAAVTATTVTASLKSSTFNTIDQNAIIANTTWALSNPRVIVNITKGGVGSGGLGVDASGYTSLFDETGTQCLMVHGGAATIASGLTVSAGGITVSAGASSFQNVSVGGGSIASQPLGVHVAANLNLYVYNNSGLTLQAANDAFNANIAMAFAASSFEFRIGSVVFDSAFACNGATAQAKQVSGGTLAGVIAALVANGILSS